MQTLIAGKIVSEQRKLPVIKKTLNNSKRTKPTRKTMTLNVYIPNNRILKYTYQKLIERKETIHNCCRDFNTLLPQLTQPL